MTPSNLKKEDISNIDKLTDVVEKAGNMLLKKFHARNQNHLNGIDTGVAVEKSERELVIQEDLLSEKMIINEIKNLDPGAVIYSEEKNNTNLLPDDNSAYKYILDPLDGTHNFYYGLPYWGIALAVLNELNEAVAGLINIPCLNLFLLNEGHGSPTFLKQGNGWLKVKTTRRTLEKALICYDNQFHRLGERAIAIYDILAHDAFTSRITGSAAADAALIATGRINGRIWNSTVSYDIAAGIPIVLGAGGFVSDFKGNSITVLRRNVIMCSDKFLLKQLIEEIGKT